MVLMLCAAATVAVAQLLLKSASAQLPAVTLGLLGGLALYGVGGAFMILSFRGAEVSRLYPCLATSNIWVALGAYTFLGEALPPLRIGGIVLTIAGVALLGWRNQ